VIDFLSSAPSNVPLADNLVSFFAKPEKKYHQPGRS
jgi:hypothetical protein